MEQMETINGGVCENAWIGLGIGLAGVVAGAFVPGVGWAVAMYYLSIVDLGVCAAENM